MRDYALGTTFDIKFTTRRFSTGAPFTLAGTPSVAIYADNSTTEITAGLTLTVDFDSRTGLNNVRVVATSGNGFAAGSNYSLVITAGTVDGVSVVGEVVGEFSIEAQSPLRPTTAGRTFDVTATGAGGVDWGNLENPSTANNLSGTTIGTVSALANNSITAAAAAADFGAELQALITGGAYALSTDANGRVRIVDGTGTGELDTTSGLVSLSAASLAAAADALLDRADGIETSVTPRQLLRGVGACLLGLVSGAGSGTEVVKGVGQSSGGTTRLTYTVDSSGNRTAVTLNL